MENLKSHILEVYKVQVDCLKGSKSNSYDKNDMKKNVFEYLVWTSHEIKKVGEIFAKPLLKKENLSPLKHFIW